MHTRGQALTLTRMHWRVLQVMTSREPSGISEVRACVAVPPRRVLGRSGIGQPHSGRSHLFGAPWAAPLSCCTLGQTDWFGWGHARQPSVALQCTHACMHARTHARTRVHTHSDAQADWQVDPRAQAQKRRPRRADSQRHTLPRTHAGSSASRRFPLGGSRLTVATHAGDHISAVGGHRRAQPLVPRPRQSRAHTHTPKMRERASERGSE